MGPGATDTTGIIPEIATMLSGLAEPPQLEPDQARFRLFDSVATFIKNSAASTPLAFVLDDLQWADCQGAERNCTGRAEQNYATERRGVRVKVLWYVRA